MSHSQVLTHSLLGLSLIGDGLHSLLECFLIEEIVVLNGSEVLVELVDKGTSGGDIILDDLFVSHSTQVLDDSSQGVTVSHNDHALSIQDLWADLIVPER